jgi:hypothetical protein
METFAICNWRISPFNDFLNKPLSPLEQTDHLFLIIPKDSGVSVLKTKEEPDSYLACSFPIGDIQAIFPLRKIKVIAGQNADGDDIAHDMLYHRVILSDTAKGKPVIVTKNIDGTNNMQAMQIIGDQLTAVKMEAWITDNAINLANINITISRDPESCPDVNA